VGAKSQYVFGGFVELLQQFAGSGVFLIGIILFTAGSALSFAMTFSVFSIIPLVLLLLPIIGFWFMYASSKNPGLPDKSLSAVSLFQASVIIDLILYCIIAVSAFGLSILVLALANTLGTGYFFSALSNYGIASWASDAAEFIRMIGFVLLIATGVFILVIVIYFRSILKILSAIKRGLFSNTFSVLPCVGIFTALTFIGILFSLVSAIAGVAGGTFAKSLYNSFDLPSQVQGFLNPIVYNFVDSAVLSGLFSIAANIGIILCIVALLRFNSALKQKQYGSGA